MLRVESKTSKNITCHVLNGSIQIKLPKVDVLNSFTQLVSDVILGAVGPSVGGMDQLLGLFSGPEHFQ